MWLKCKIKPPAWYANAASEAEISHQIDTFKYPHAPSKVPKHHNEASPTAVDGDPTSPPQSHFFNPFHLSASCYAVYLLA